MKKRFVKKTNKKHVKRAVKKHLKKSVKKHVRKYTKKYTKKPVIKPAKKLGKKELADYRKLILIRKDEVLEGIKHIADDTLKKSQKDASGDISGYTYHMADVATDTYDREFSLGLASNEREIIYAFDEALKRIEEGTYGICEDCRKAIPKIRLKAVPYASLCIKCQEIKEKK